MKKFAVATLILSGLFVSQASFASPSQECLNQLDTLMRNEGVLWDWKAVLVREEAKGAKGRDDAAQARAMIRHIEGTLPAQKNAFIAGCMVNYGRPILSLD